jgi:hypothetical protein
VIRTVIDNWHAHLRGELPGGLDELLHDDCVFWSPVVHSPQRGKELTKLYLAAAYQVMPGDGDGGAGDGGAGDGDPSGGGGSFRYTKHVLDDPHAVLEFETTMGDTVVNGVDIITCDADGRIVEFKVMVRPKRAMDTVHARMAAMLEAMAPGEG